MQNYKIISNCEEYKEIGLVSKKIKTIIVSWVDEFGHAYQEDFRDLYEAYVLAFQVGVFDTLQTGSKVEITVLFEDEE